jgi:hypothetical protein
MAPAVIAHRCLVQIGPAPGDPTEVPATTTPWRRSHQPRVRVSRWGLGCPAIDVDIKLLFANRMHGPSRTLQQAAFPVQKRRCSVPFLELLERSGDYAADLGLTSQEIDPEKGVLLGNDPTASRSWLWSDGAVNIGRAEGLAP